MKPIPVFATMAILLMTLASCGRQSRQRLEAALAQSGDNASQLEAVINHYSQRPEDSLHLAAARFLIENMPGHYAIDNAFVRRYRQANDSVYPHMSNVVKRVVHNIPVREPDFLGKYETVADCRVISGVPVKHRVIAPLLAVAVCLPAGLYAFAQHRFYRAFPEPCSRCTVPTTVRRWPTHTSIMTA